MTKREKAQSLFKGGYNCAQAVFAAFCDETGLDESTALRLSSAFGGGMGRMREVCGAVSGMLMALGMLKGYSEAGDDNIKKELYQRVQTLAGEFRDKSGSIICRELMALPERISDPTPEKRTAEYYGHRKSCIDAVGNAAEILESYLNSFQEM